jgi:uracil-DNA glycosylase family 4
MQDLLSCKKCPRIVNNLDKLRKIYPNYLNRPIIPIKRNESSIAIVGLAPGLTGANRTGNIFNGDFSGDILNKAIKLSRINFENNLLHPYITNAIKCYPPNNKPNASEINNCNIYLKQELESLNNLKVIIALGSISHNSILKSYSLVKQKYKFSHGFAHKINRNLVLIDSYHCSKMNINTKRLTLAMLINILNLAISNR